MKHAFIAFIVLFGLSPALFVYAQSGSSAQYESFDMGTVPATVEASSPGYILNGSVEAIVGEGLTSTNYQGGVGSPVPQEPDVVVPPVPPPTSGGGGGLGDSRAPTLRHRIWTYLPVGTINGERGEAGAIVFLNDSTVGIEYTGALQWQKSAHPLGLGNNLLSARSQYGQQYSERTESIMRRRLVGDVNDSQYVDDIDLSLFSRAWGKPIPEADFNEDGKVDDLDLSLLASHWHQRF